MSRTTAWLFVAVGVCSIIALAIGFAPFSAVWAVAVVMLVIVALVTSDWRNTR